MGRDLIDTSNHAQMALLRRAAAGDEDAWKGFHDQMDGLILTWMGQLTGSLESDEREAVANDALARFARHLTTEKLAAFPSYGQVVQYLKRCTHSATIDALRARQARTREVSLEALIESEHGGEQILPRHAPSAETTACARLGVAEIRQAVQAALPTAQQRQLAWLALFQGYRPREILARFPDRYPNPEAVSQAIRTVRESLQRDPSLRHLFDCDDCST